MTCARLALRRMQRSSVMNAAGRGRSLGAIVAMCSLLAWDCTGKVVDHGPVDASSTSGEGGRNMDAGSSSDAAPNVDAPPCSPVLASDYDQSCTVDTDCVEVGEVAECPATACDECTTEAINKNAMAQYMTALSPAFASEPAGEDCNCNCEGTAVCRGGKCQEGYCAPPSADTLPACADAGDAGGVCVYSTNTGCSRMGPPDACAYSDEMCCLR